MQCNHGQIIDINLYPDSIDPYSKQLLQGSDSDANEFYKKNSRWSEGLISAAKQVTCGASMLV